MGMSSSQARLLTLTARQHSIEHKAQKVQADKLRLANESDRVYNEYLNALDAKKIQYKAITADGSTTYRDATLAILENGAVPTYTGETSSKTYLIQNANTNEIYITPEFAAQYGLEGGSAPQVGTLDEYLTEQNCTKTERQRTVTNYNDVSSINPVCNSVTSTPGSIPGDPIYSVSGSLNPSTVTPYSTGSTSYSLSTNITAASISQDPVMDTITKVGTSNISAGTTESSSTSALTSKTWTLGSTYTALDSEILKFDQNVLNMSLYDIYCAAMDARYPEGWDSTNFGHDDEISIHYGNEYNDNYRGNYTVAHQSLVSYSGNTEITLKEALQQLANNSNGNLTFDEENRTISCSEGFYLTSTNNNYQTGRALDGIVSSYLKANGYTKEKLTEEKDLKLDTKLVDIVGVSVANYLTVEPFAQIKNEDGTFTTLKTGITDQNATVEDYLKKLQENYPQYNINYSTDENGQITITSTADLYFNFARGKISNFDGFYEDSRTINENVEKTINVSYQGLIDNLCLAKAVHDDVSKDNYNDSLSTNQNTVKTNLNNLTQTQEGLKILAQLSDSLVKYLQNPEQYANYYDDVISKVFDGSFTSVPSSYIENDYSTTTDPRNSQNGDVDRSATYNDSISYTFVLDTSETNFTAADGATVAASNVRTQGVINSANTDDIKKQIATALATNDNNLGEPSTIASNNLMNQLTDLELATVSTYYGTSEWNSVIEAFADYLNTGDKSSLSTYITTTQSGTVTNTTDSNNNYIYSVVQSAPSNSTILSSQSSSNGSVNTASLSDIATQLAKDMNTSGSSTFNYDSVKNTILSNFTERQLQNISTYYGTSDWTQIVSYLNNGDYNTVKTNYGNRYSDSQYDFSSASSDNMSTGTSQSAATPYNGKLDIPNLKGIASNITVALRKANYQDIDETEIYNNLKSLYNENNDSDKNKLANLNKYITDYLQNGTGNMNTIYDHIFNNGSLNISDSYSQYDITVRDMGTCSATYGTTQEGTGEWDWDLNDYYYQCVAQWNALKALEGYSFVIVTQEQANSTSFVSNYLSINEGVVLEFNTQSTNMTESSVSVETSLQEVSDETDLKKAEAKYEADMNRINKKDTRYDNELAQFETERTAIKDEIETLQTVIKENVEKTFKLFS
jgi:hypothetical protein